MKKTIILLVGVFFLVGCVVHRIPVNKAMLQNKVINDKEYRKSKFLTVDSCRIGFVVGDENSERDTIGGRHASLTLATCVLTEKQMIVYRLTKDGKVKNKLYYLDYKDMVGVGSYQAFSFSCSQLQIKTKKGIIGISPTTKNDIEKFKQNKEIIIQRGVKEFTAKYYIVRG